MGVDLTRLTYLAHLVGLPLLFVAAPGGVTFLTLNITETTPEAQLAWTPVDGTSCNRPDEDPHQVELWTLKSDQDTNLPPRWGLINAGQFWNDRDPVALARTRMPVARTPPTHTRIMRPRRRMAVVKTTPGRGRYPHHSSHGGNGPIL